MHFDLEVNQFDIVNVFINTKRGKVNILVVYLLLNGFKILKIYIEVDKVLYSLRDSLVL
jgi:hypothetical protein